MEIDLENAARSLPIEHQNVPAAHQGLHGFLYSSEDEHSAETAVVEIENDGTQVMAIETWRSESNNAKVAGVYAVLDADRRTQYIGYSRNILLSIDSHIAANGEEKCAFTRVQTFKFPKREEMEKLCDAWIAQIGSIPPGNGEQKALWASTVGEAARAAMSPEEQKAYEEKKLKLRKAMADSSLAKELESAGNEAGDREQNLAAAVNNDDWSAVIRAQTQETKSGE